MLRLSRSHLIAVPALAGALLCSCKREERTFRVEPPYVTSVDIIPVTAFHAGGGATTQPGMQPTTFPSSVHNDYEENAYAVSEGKRLFGAFNCTGCHFHGGGGIGPPLMDDKWFYGSAPEQIYATILQGRPNGMPSYVNKIPNHQVWQISAYVRSMSGLISSSVAPGRSEQMNSGPPENSRSSEHPKDSFTPKSTEMPQ
jgi:cytochrome c oxidase cbb3-type subunit 3